jgi:hypothetical protein
MNSALQMSSLPKLELPAYGAFCGVIAILCVHSLPCTAEYERMCMNSWTSGANFLWTHNFWLVCRSLRRHVARSVITLHSYLGILTRQLGHCNICKIVSSVQDPHSKRPLDPDPHYATVDTYADLYNNQCCGSGSARIRIKIAAWIRISKKMRICIQQAKFGSIVTIFCHC